MQQTRIDAQAVNSRKVLGEVWLCKVQSDGRGTESCCSTSPDDYYRRACVALARLGLRDAFGVGRGLVGSRCTQLPFMCMLLPHMLRCVTGPTNCTGGGLASLWFWWMRAQQIGPRSQPGFVDVADTHGLRAGTTHGARCGVALQPRPGVASPGLGVTLADTHTAASRVHSSSSLGSLGAAAGVRVGRPCNAVSFDDV
jgi:hypothetical protein